LALLISGALFNANLQLKSQEIDKQKGEIKRIQGEAATTLLDANKRLDDVKLVQRRTAFWGDLGRAHRELKERYPLRGSEILDRHLDSDLRGWEWHYLRRQCQNELYSIQSGELCLAWSPDGAHLATGFEQNRVIVLRDVANGKIVRRLSHPDEQGMFLGAVFDKSGKRLLGFDNAKRFTLWDLPSGKVIRAWNEKDTWGPAALRPDGGQIATAVERDSDQVQLWDADSGKLTKALQVPLPYAHRNSDGTTYAGAMVRALAYSPDGKRLAMGTVGGLLVLWNTDTYEKTGELTLGRFIHAIAFDPAGDLLYATDTGANIHVIGIDPQGKCSKVSSIYLGKVNEGSVNRSRSVTLAVDPRGRRLATASRDRVIRLWNVRDNELHLLAAYSGHEQEVDAVAFSPDGRRIVSLDFEWFKARSIKFWAADILDVPADGWPAHLTGDLLACTPDPTGRYLAVARAHRTPSRLGSSMELCEAKSGKVLWELTSHNRWTGVPSRQAFAFSPDGNRLATMDAIDSPNVVRVWDIDNRKKLFELEKAGEYLTYSPDGRWLATMGRHDGVIQFWDAATGKRAFAHTCSKKYDDGAATQYGAILAFTPDSKSLVIGSGLLMEVHNDRLKEVHTFAFPERKGFVDGAGCLAISPDGRYLAASPWPGGVDLWDLKNRRLHQKVSESRLPWTHIGAFNNLWLAFTPDSKRLAYATEFGAVHLWDVEAGQDVLVLEEGQERDYQRVVLYFSKDGNKLHALSKNRDFHNTRCRWDIWNATPLAEDVFAVGLASKLLDELAKAVGLKDEMQTRIEVNADLKPTVRTAALKQLVDFAENTGELNDLSYAVAIKANATPKEYQLAVRQAERAHSLAPSDPHIRHTLGVAYFRVGECVKAREAIRHAIATRAEGKRREEYYDLAFLAMIEHHLGDPGAARALLGKMRKANSGAGPVGHAETQYRAFLAEAEALIEGKR
jgi:WD40 repeat protein